MQPLLSNQMKNGVVLLGSVHRQKEFQTLKSFHHLRTNGFIFPTDDQYLHLTISFPMALHCFGRGCICYQSTELCVRSWIYWTVWGSTSVVWLSFGSVYCEACCYRTCEAKCAIFRAIFLSSSMVGRQTFTQSHFHLLATYFSHILQHWSCFLLVSRSVHRRRDLDGSSNV